MKTTEDFTNKLKEMIPQVNINKNGYEIRTQVLELAKEQSEFEFSSKWMGWEHTVKRDPNTNEVVTTVGMPEVPGVDKILETAERFLDFVNRK